jgi:chaperonin GroEL
VALIRALSSLDSLKFNDDRAYGVNIIRRAVEEPLRQISSNAGVDGSIVVEKVKNGKGAFGFNAATEEYEDMVKAGVIDPTKVVRAALQNAASVASLMLTTEALVAERPKKKAAAGGHGGHGGGGGGGMGGMGGMGGDEDF